MKAKYKLYDRQEVVAKEGLSILNKHGMLYLALEPRYGKSPISLKILDRQDTNQEVLFITTKSAIDGIHQVIKDFNIHLLVDVINYESLHKLDIKAYDTIVIDEANVKISSFPKQSKAYKQIRGKVLPDTQIIWLSGTPQIESSAKMFHQLSLSPRHSFYYYDSFYEWFNGSNHYKNNVKNLPGYGVQGIFKYTGGPRPSIDYSKTVNFNHKIDPIIIRRVNKDENMLPRVILRYVEAPKNIKEYISSIKRYGIVETDYGTFIGDSGAGRLSKMHQLSGGTCIDDEDNRVELSHFKAQSLYNYHKGTNTAIFYKYKAEYDLLSNYFDSNNLYQIDSMVTGIDMSHYDDMAIYSLTFSGSNYTQCLSRLANSNRKERPTVYIYISSDVDRDIYNTVSEKKDMNTKFLLKE